MLLDNGYYILFGRLPDLLTCTALKYRIHNWLHFDYIRTQSKYVAH